jgi:unspecific monooxygenase
MSQPATAPTMADNFFLEAMKPAFREDPYPFYERFRGTAPLLRVADTIWFALGHAEVAAMLRHPRLSTDELQHATTKSGRAPDPNRVRSLLFMDAPDHTRLRGLVARAFTPRRIDDLRAATEGITAELIGAMAARLRNGSGTVDLIEAFAYPLPVRVICTLLGVPARDEATFTDWSRGIARSVDPSILRSPEVEAAIVDARQGLQTYLGELLAERRRKPGDDLLSALAAVDVDGDSITAREIVSLAQLLLVAGHETTVNLIGNGMLALLRAPDQLAQLRQRPELVGPAVDEFLRFEPSRGHTPGHLSLRLTTPAGTAVFSGDLMHRTVQVAEPQWSSQFCHDPAHAARTRREFVERHADTGTLILPAHFPVPGYIVRAPGGGHRFTPAPAGAAA